jgi:hypothetical protein
MPLWSTRWSPGISARLRADEPAVADEQVLVLVAIELDEHDLGMVERKFCVTAGEAFD